MRRGLTDLEIIAVRMSVGALPDREQRVIREHFWRSRELGEIAHILKVRVDEVRAILADALRQVRMTLELLFGFDFS